MVKANQGLKCMQPAITLLVKKSSKFVVCPNLIKILLKMCVTLPIISCKGE